MFNANAYEVLGEIQKYFFDFIAIFVHSYLWSLNYSLFSRHIASNCKLYWLYAERVRHTHSTDYKM